jgi:hypothetical protein
MSRGLLWLALADLGQAWLRSGLAALTIAAAILAVAFFAGQIQLRQREVLAGYEAAGAATFVVQLTGVPDDEIDPLAGSVRTVSDVRSVEAPYSGLSSSIAVDTSFLVFRNEQQQEYLGARTSVLGVDRSFELARDYYVDFHEVNPQAPQIVLGMPLLVTAGEARAPGPQEVLVASGVADYVGVQPGAEAIVEFVYSGPGEPIIQRFDGLRLIGSSIWPGRIKAGSSHSGVSMRADRMYSPFGPKPPASGLPHCRSLSTSSCSENSSRQYRMSLRAEEAPRQTCRGETSSSCGQVPSAMCRLPKRP